MLLNVELSFYGLALTKEPLTWLFKANEHEYSVLEHEISVYNQWIHEFLLKGHAPTASYALDCVAPCYSSAVVTALYHDMARNGATPYGFYSASLEDNTLDMFYFELQVVEEDVKKAWIRGEERLRLLLTMPYGKMQFSMGYKVLPMTERLLRRNAKDDLSV